MALRVLVLVLALLLASACGDSDTTGGGDTAADPTPPGEPSVAPAPAGTPESDGGRLVAVVRPTGPLELFSVDPSTRVATPVRALEPPVAGAQVVDVAMSDGAEPVVCASWHLTPGPVFEDLATALSCYPSGSTRGSEVAGVERPAQVALTPDGTRIAWSLASQGEANPVFSTATLSDGGVADVQRLRGRAAGDDQTFTGTDVQDLAWTDDSHVAVSTSVQSDDGPELFLVDVDADPGSGWLDAPVVPAPTDPPYATYDGVTSADATTALADKRGLDQGGQRPPDQAVRIDLASGRVLEVVATAAEGRDLVAVSGTEDAVVYVTGVFGADGVTDAKAYLRLRGEPRGTLLTGLPADAQTVLAQG